MYKSFVTEILIEENYFTNQELQVLYKQSQVEGKGFLRFLLEEQFISDRDLLPLVAKKLGLKYSTNPMELFQLESLKYMTEDFARRNQIIPLYEEDSFLYIATAKPHETDVFEDLTMITGLDTRPVVVPSSIIDSTITRVFSEAKASAELLNHVDVSEEDANLMGRVESAPIVKLVNSIISAAYNENSSDIHIDPEIGSSMVRFRIDGQLSRYTQIKHDSHDPIITRIKILAGMNIAEKRVPQDGALRLELNKKFIDMRIATIPTRFGEKIVMRILGNEKGIDYKIDQLEMNAKMHKYLKDLTKIPNGIILITGPTGSGKTTTLYSMLNELATPDKSVITIEDPVEKQFEGITQVGINTKAGLNFASGLRSILRLDPDVIMIGEIRDAETASISIRAAITGHLVLSTLHTNDALSSITRLIDMGTESYMVASSVKSVIAQRLVRKNCEYCKKEVELTQEDQILLQDNTIQTYFQGEGCSHCDYTGFHGRIAVFEAIPIDQKLQTMVAEGKTYQEMHQYVVSQDIPLLKDDLIRLLKGGDTTVNETRKVLFSNELT